MGQQDRRRTLSGICFALSGFIMLSLGDSIAKSITADWPGPAVTALRFAFGSLLIGIILWMREGRAALALSSSAAQLGRGVAVGLGSMLFFSSLALMPLGEATTITFLGPVIVGLLSPLMLREKVAPAIWLATAIAFAGVLVATRPSPDHLGWAALLPVATACCTAMMILLNRMVAGSGSVLRMQWLLSATATPVAIAVALGGHLLGFSHFVAPAPDVSILLRCLLLAMVASTAHGFLFMATERLAAANMAPFAYVQLVASILLGAILFEERPDLLMLVGGGMIIVSGLLLWRAEMRAASVQS